MNCEGNADEVSHERLRPTKCLSSVAATATNAFCSCLECKGFGFEPGLTGINIHFPVVEFLICKLAFDQSTVCSFRCDVEAYIKQPWPGPERS